MYTITSAAAAFRNKTLTPVDLLEQCLARIDQLEERVRAWVFVDRERARADAVRLTNELKHGTNRGPLHGIPIGVKDLFDVFDWPTAAGSKRWANSYARQDCPAIARLRDAGAVLMGKTVTVAYAAFDPPVTTNPWNPERTPGGSSSGSAAAVACGMCLGALGSQTGGSITRPASYCGVYGLKPTFGRISLDGVVPFAPSFDHAGVIANGVLDLAILLQPLSANTSTQVPEYTAKRGCKWLSLPGGYFANRATTIMNEAFEVLTMKLRAKNWQIETSPLPPSVADIPKYHRMIMSVESAAFHGERLKRYPDDYPPMLTALLHEGQKVAAPDYHKARQHYEEMAARPPRTAPYLALATTEPPPDKSTTGPNHFQAPWSYMGKPTISMPFAWTDDGLPMCIQLAGHHWEEEDLIAVACALEEDIGFEKREVV
jgi:Asp-tRNA(Asn)/Glu-tRNA(Gln) amidotransferase A subunit family amidase